MFVWMERAINRRQQGDLGEASAIEWLTSRGALVLIPFGHSPDYDLVAQIDGRLLRIQVKTTTQITQTPNGHLRFPVSIATSGGNQSWNGVVRVVDPASIDYLFVLTGCGRRWLIPATALESKRTIQLGGSRYAENEIEPGTEISSIVFGRNARLDLPAVGGVSKRSKDGGCKPSGLCPSEVRILPPPLASAQPVKPTNYERKPGQRGEAVINQKRRLTIPQRPFFEAGFANGGRVRVRADGPGRIIIEQIELPEWAREPAGAERRAPD
jgi:PD-(D/E)XK endonuclease